MRNNPYNIIKSVMGFDLTCKVQDENGQPVNSGVIYSDYKAQIKPVCLSQVTNKKFWNNFNQDLYDKFLDYKRSND